MTALGLFLLLGGMVTSFTAIALAESPRRRRVKAAKSAMAVTAPSDTLVRAADLLMKQRSEIAHLRDELENERERRHDLERRLMGPTSISVQGIYADKIAAPKLDALRASFHDDAPPSATPADSPAWGWHIPTPTDRKDQP